MISFLIDSIVNIGDWILYAIETAINAVLAAFGAIAGAALAVLPAMPSAPSIDTSPWLGWLNWLVPVSVMLDTASGLLALYVVVLGVRWVLQKAGLID